MKRKIAHPSGKRNVTPTGKMPKIKMPRDPDAPKPPRHLTKMAREGQRMMQTALRAGRGARRGS